jgi:hypothetical protein
MIAVAASPEAKEHAEGVKAKVTARIDELEAQLVAGKSGLQPKLDAVIVAGKRPLRRIARASLRPRRHAEPPTTSRRCLSLLAVRPSAFMSAKPFSPYGDPGHRAGCRPSNRDVYLHRNGTHRHPYTMELGVVG